MDVTHSVMEPGPITGSMVGEDNDDNNNDDILTRAEATELEEIARSPERNQESRERSSSSIGGFRRVSRTSAPRTSEAVVICN